MAAVRMASPPVLLLLPLLFAVLCRGLERSDDNEVAPLEDAWDCMATWSLPCIQKKLLVFVDRVGRLKQVDLFGDAVSVVRVGGEPSGHPVTEEELQARLLPGDDEAVGALLQHAVLSFLDSHVVRVSLPDGISASTGGRALTNTFEVNLGRAFQEARGKKKKNMMMLGAMMMAKTAMLGKMMMLLIKFKAMKALLLSVLALALAKIQLFKSLKGGGGKGGKETFIIIKGGKGGGGGGGHGGGGYSSGGPSGGGGWSDGSSSAGWSSGGGGSSAGWQSDSGGGGASWPSSGGGGSSSGGWSSGGGGGGGGSAWSGGGGGGSSSGWGRNYDSHWLAYRGQAYNNTAT